MAAASGRAPHAPEHEHTDPPTPSALWRGGPLSDAALALLWVVWLAGAVLIVAALSASHP
jgi:hypothetical protein